MQRPPILQPDEQKRVRRSDSPCHRDPNLRFISSAHLASRRRCFEQALLLPGVEQPEEVTGLCVTVIAVAVRVTNSSAGHRRQAAR